MLTQDLLENRRPDAPPNIGVHLKAAGVLLSRRDSKRTSREATQPTVVFERICIESFLYHSTLMMLFDPSLDEIPIGNLPGYLTYASVGSRERATTQPILDQPYPFFLLIADVTRLARISRPLNYFERQTWTRLQAELLQIERTVSADDHAQSLYVRAMQILLLKADSMRPAKQKAAVIRAYGREALSLLYTLDVQQHLLGYALWPVAVFGAIAIDEEEQHNIESKIAPWARTRRAQAVRLQERLRHIWALPAKDEETMLLRRLRMLLNAS